MEILKALESSFNHTSGVIAGVQASQYNDKTPCEEWNVRELLEHTIGVVAGMGASVTGSARSEFVLSSDPKAQFDELAAATLSAWKTPGILEQIIDGGAGPMPGSVLARINLLDTTTHAWDLAKATGQEAILPEDLATTALKVAQGTISEEIRPGRFAPEIKMDNVGPTERLAAFLGRMP